MVKRLSLPIVLLSLVLLMGCVSEKETEKPLEKDEVKKNTEQKATDMPHFVQEKDFNQIDWDKEVTKISTNGVSDIVGNPKTVGYIGPDLVAEQTDKWLWYFFGKSQGSLTVVAYHQDTSIKVPLLTRGFTVEISGGGLDGADATAPSNVLLPKSGKWALLVYINEELMDTLVIQVKEK